MDRPGVPSLGVSVGEGRPQGEEASLTPEASGSLVMPDEQETQEKSKPEEPVEIPIKTTPKIEEAESTNSEPKPPKNIETVKIDANVLERVPGSVAEAAAANESIGSEQ